MSQIFATAEEQAPKHNVTPLFPKRSRQAQTAEVNTKKQAAARPKPWFPRIGSRQFRALPPRSISPQKRRNPWKQKLPTESQEKKSQVAEAPGGQDQKGEGRKDPSLLPRTAHEHSWKSGRGKSREEEERGFGDEQTDTETDSSGAWWSIRRT
jgi:hypothetical protein